MPAGALSMTIDGMGRSFLFVSALSPRAAADAVARAGARVDLVVRSPTDVARETAAYAVGGRRVFTVEEPLLARRVPAESSSDVAARLARALRRVAACDAHTPLVVCHELDLLGATSFTLDEVGLMRVADDLERLQPLR